MQIIQKYIPIGTKRRSGLKLLGIKFIVAHDTGNPNSTALANVNYFINSANEIETSAHTFIDDKDIIECIPQNEKAWHVRRNVAEDNIMFGVDANDYALGVELCYFPLDIPRTQRAYNNYVGYIKASCAEYNLDPKKFIVGHFQLDPTRKTDPMNAFKVIGKTWQGFIQDLSVATVKPTKEEIIKDLEAVIEKIKIYGT